MFKQRTPFQTQSIQPDQYATPRMSLPSTPYLEPTPQPDMPPMINQTQQSIPMRLYQDPNEQHDNPQMVSHGQHFGRHVFQQALQQDDPFRCNFIGQLTGSYEIHSSTGIDKVSVIVPNVSELEESYAIARTVCDDGEALPDQFIFEEPQYFTLRSVDRQVHAVMQKGINMKHFVKWRYMDGVEVIWRRTEVVFSMVSVDALSSCSRRPSISSLYSTPSTSAVSHGIETKEKEAVLNLVRPELRQMSNTPTHPVYEPRRAIQNTDDNSVYQVEHTQEIKHSSAITHFSDKSVKEKLLRDKSMKSGEAYSQQLASSISEERLFAQIKADCLRCPSLLRRLISWGSGRATSTPVTREFNKQIAEGRLWVTAKPGIPNKELDEKFQDALDDIKGAYQEIDNTGVWQQPVPQVGEPGLQHRLLRDSRGYWMIEERVPQEGNESSEQWLACAREISDERWVDLKNDQVEIDVRLVQMIAILEKMMEDQTTAESADVQKSYVEFLFKTCNQKKLNTKLKKRNLKHNIANLKVKLDKQYALSFAVKVATTAEAIIQELGE
jgi:hypothetical protein